MAINYFFLSFTIWCLFSTCQAENKPIISTDTPIVGVGLPFIVTCQFNTFAPPTGSYSGGLARDEKWILKYDFPPASSTAPRTATVTPNPHNYLDISVRSLSSNATTYQMELIAKSAGFYRYYCVMNSAVSEYLPITASQTAPTASFSLNTTQPKVGVPFQASCTLAHYVPTETSTYTVGFYSARDGLLASYETIKGRSLVMIQKHDHLTIHDGPRTGSSVFDVTLLEKLDVSQAEYWCTLEDSKLGLVVKSKHWIGEPEVKFTSSKVNFTSYRGNCALDNFEADGREFSVQFLTDAGPKSVNRLATYTARPNQLLEFIAEEPVSPWKQVLPDGVPAFPNYVILATGQASLSHTWWCLLTVGAQGSKEYREYTSGAVYF